MAPRPTARRPPARSWPASWSTTTGPSASGRTPRTTSAKRGLTDPDLCGPEGRLRRRLAPEVDPEDGELRDAAARAGRDHRRRPRAPGRLRRGPDPGSSHRASGRTSTAAGCGPPRHCYLPGPLRGVLNFQAARPLDEVSSPRSILDALSFHQAGIATAIPIYGTNGFTRGPPRPPEARGGASA